MVSCEARQPPTRSPATSSMPPRVMDERDGIAASGTFVLTVRAGWG
jgi:hypothetical protein